MRRQFPLLLAALAFTSWAAAAPPDSASQVSKTDSQDSRTGPRAEKERPKSSKARFAHGHDHDRLCDRSRCYEFCDHLENDSSKGLRRLRAAECRADCMEDCD